MYPFPQSVTPAARNHMEAQLNFFNEMSRSLFRTMQQCSDLNIQLAQTMLEQGTTAGQQLITANRPTEAIASAASHAQPAAEKLRAYQQHLSRIAADTQVDMSKVAEEHIQETSRTAKALADEVARVTSEETEKTLRTHQQAVEKFSDPFKRQADGMQQSRGSQMHGSQTMQSAGQNGVDGASRQSSGAGSTGSAGSAGAGMPGAQQGGQPASPQGSAAHSASQAAQASAGSKQTSARKDS